jgi:putative transposase
VIIRYDPRELAEILVFHRGRFLSRAICPDLVAASHPIARASSGRTPAIRLTTMWGVHQRGCGYRASD